jgi:enterochelin esterase-like enzyme
MPHLPIAVCCAALLFATLPAQREGRGPREQGGPTLANFTVEAGTLKSDKVHQGEAGYTIYLPKGYADEANKEKKYPWVLWLPGFGGPDEFQNRGGAKVLDRLRGEDKIVPMAFVVFRAPARRSVYMNGESQCDTEDLIVGDCIDELQKKYRLATDKKDRALMGVSAGGFGAMKIAMRHPDVFGAVAVHSAAILPADPDDLGGMNETIVQRNLRGGIAKEIGDPIDKGKWGAHMPLAIVAQKKPEDMKGLQIYFDVGTDDGYGFCPPNEQLSKLMTERGWKHLFRKVEGGGHAWGDPSMDECVATSLQFVSAAVSGKDAVDAMSVAKPASGSKEDAKKDAPKKEEAKK